MQDSVRRWLTSLLCLGAFWTGCVRGACGQDMLPLLMEVDSTSFNSRTCGPIPLLINMQYEGESLLEGSLAMEFKDYLGVHLCSMVVDDFFVSPGQQQMALLVPALRQAADEQIDIFATLTTSTKKWNVKPMMLRAPGLTKRTMAVSIGIPEVDMNDTEAAPQDITAWLRIESLQPNLTQLLGGVNRTAAQTLYTLNAIEEFPADPHWHCVSDVVVLLPDALVKIDPTRLDALVAWVRAGGSLCLFAGDRLHSPEVIDKLNALIGSQHTDLHLLTDSNGEILWDALSTDYAMPRSMHCGLGRLVLCRHIPEVTKPSSDSPQWRAAGAFLWKLRQDQMDAQHASGTWSLEIAQKIGAESYDQDQYGQYGQGQAVAVNFVTDFAPRPIGGGPGLIENLSPHGMKIVPLWLIGLIGLLYVLAVGPLDYWLLGRLKMRKYTWLLFPAVTIMFLAGTVMASSLFIRGNDEPGIATFKDIVDSGVVARENQLQLLFTGGSRMMETEAARCLFSTMAARDFGTHTSRGYQVRQDDIVPTVLHGRMPTLLTAVQSVPQWTPQLNRLCKIHRVPVIDDSGFDWDAPIDVTTKAGRDALRQRVVAAFGSEATVHAYVNIGRVNQSDNGDQAMAVFSKEGIVKLRLAGEPRVFPYSEDSLQQGFITSIPTPAVFSQRHRDFLDQMSVREQPGLFSVVSQVSPMGGYRFEDMSLLDPSDLNSTLLVIAVKNDGPITVYRRLYR